MSPTGFPANGGKSCASSPSIPVRVWAAHAGIWNHRCTQINTDKKKRRGKNNITINLSDFCMHFTVSIIASQTFFLEFVFSPLLSVFICVHLWFQSYLLCHDAGAIYDCGMRATKLESARCEH